MSVARRRRRRGFTLMEAVALVVIVAIGVPPIIAATTAGARAVVDEQRGLRAVWLASSVLETITADAASGDGSLGFVALDDPGYVDGLRARIADVTAPYQDAGLVFEVEIGAPVDIAGDAAAPDDPLALRRITVRVTFPTSAGETATAPFDTVVVNR